MQNILKPDMKVPVICGLLLLVVLVDRARSVCDGDSSINGCSFPAVLLFPYNLVFRQACNRHDVCYGCGSGRGITRAACDNAFPQDMRRICSLWPGCIVNEAIFTLAVRKFGEDHYHTTPLPYCSASWVSDCLPK